MIFREIKYGYILLVCLFHRALEGVDSMLRSTRNFDVFQCLERISCEMAAPLRDNGNRFVDDERQH